MDAAEFSQRPNRRIVMKRIVWGTLALVAMAAPALAADLPMKAPPPAPVIPMYNWSGFYIGANGGWASSDNCWDIITVTFVLSEGCHGKSGGVIGGQVGYRWQQPGSHFVWGLEAQGDWANLSRSRISVLDPAFTLNSKVDGIGLFTGQFGFAWDAWLWYLKSGFAVTGNRFDVTSTVGGVDLVSASSTRWGGVVGTGFEYGFGAWSIGIEYDHLFMNSSDLAFTTGGGPNIAVVPTAFVLNRVSQDVDMVTLRFNYRFGGYGGPVVARY
jgi:outer membrane immunogenic protein